jgi:predicted RNase H-like HicB family nuclease
MKRLKKVKRNLVLRGKKRAVKGMKKIEFASVVWREARYYVAQCLNVDVSSFGRTKPAALKNLKEAVQLYYEDKCFGELMHVAESEKNIPLAEAKRLFKFK